MKKVVSIIAFAALSTALMGQNFNPTVEVVGTYKVKPVELSKPVVSVAVPDTVTKFDIDFDYHVSPKEYKGSYSFTPYSVDVLPAQMQEQQKLLYLRAGAGYTLHPELDFVLSPRLKSAYHKLNIYGTHRSYVGNYRTIVRSEDGLLDWNGERFKGYETYTNAGFNGTALFKNGTGRFNYDLSYIGYARQDSTLRHNFDAAKVDLSVSSRTDDLDQYSYFLGLTYLYGQDKLYSRSELSPMPMGEDFAYLTENDVALKIEFARNYSLTQKLIVDIEMLGSLYSAYFTSTAAHLKLNPKYVWRKNRLYMKLGASLDLATTSDQTDWSAGASPVKMHRSGGQLVYPDVELSYDVVRRSLNIYLSATGGLDTNPYSTLFASNPYMTLSYAQNFFGMALLANTVERVNAQVGLKGQVAARLSYNARAGYVYRTNELCDAVLQGSEGLSSTLAYADNASFFAAADLNWHSQWVTAALHAKYNHSSLVAKEEIGFEQAPLLISGNAEYRWNERISAGVHISYCYGRRGYSGAYSEDGSIVTGDLLRIPGWLNCGVNASYQYSRKLAFWLWSDNLLCQTIQLHPLYAQGSPTVTVGITLSL